MITSVQLCHILHWCDDVDMYCQYDQYGSTVRYCAYGPWNTVHSKSLLQDVLRWSWWCLDVIVGGTSGVALPSYCYWWH